MFAMQLSGERRFDARPVVPGLCLFSGGGGRRMRSHRERHRNAGIVRDAQGSSHRALIDGIVPDGVATVTFCYPAGPASGFSRKIILPAVCLKGHAVNNVVIVSVPRGAGNALAPKMVWRNAAGQAIKTIPSRR